MKKYFCDEFLIIINSKKDKLLNLIDRAQFDFFISILILFINFFFISFLSINFPFQLQLSHTFLFSIQIYLLISYFNLNLPIFFSSQFKFTYKFLISVYIYLLIPYYNYSKNFLFQFTFTHRIGNLCIPLLFIVILISFVILYAILALLLIVHPISSTIMIIYSFLLLTCVVLSGSLYVHGGRYDHPRQFVSNISFLFQNFSSHFSVFIFKIYINYILIK